MINLKAFVNSMKLTWLRRVIISNSLWQSIVNYIINFQELFSFGKVYIDRLIENVKKNDFWTDVLRTYSEPITYINKTPKILSYQALSFTTKKFRLVESHYG